MSGLLLSGGTLVTTSGEQKGSLRISGDSIVEAGHEPAPGHGCEIIDVSGCLVTPGLIDLQVNGGFGCNLWGDPLALEFDRLGREMLKRGITAFLPTLITDSIAHLQKNIAFLESRGVGQLALPVGTDGQPLPRLPGIHLEGPFLSPHKPGVHPPEHVIPLELNAMRQLLSSSVKLITVAPETDQSGAVVTELLEKGLVVSLGHSNATFDEAQSAFNRGVALVTHIFNAMPPIHHRNPGAVTAALLDKRVRCCIICDGLHVSKEAVSLVLALKGIDKTVLVTDIAEIGTRGGGLVGSSITLDQAVRNVVHWGVCSFADAITMTTSNPAQVLGLSEIGSLEVGCKADLLVWNMPDMSIRHVFIGGRLVA